MSRKSNESAGALISAFVKAEPTWSHTKIAEAILEEYPSLGLTVKTLRMLVSQYRSGNDEIVVKSTEKPEEKAWVKEDVYFVASRYGTITMPVKTIDKIFLYYSKHGYNLTGDEIQAKFDLKPHEWVAVKNALNLYKTSNIFSPHTREITPIPELEILIENEMQKLFRNKGIVEKKYNQTLSREYKRSIEKSNLRDAEMSHLMTEIHENLDIIKGEQYVIPIVKTSEKGTCIVPLSDVHFGVKFESKIHKFTMNAVEGTLMDIADTINSLGYKKVVVIFMGDLIHNFKEMHHGMWQETDVEEGIGGKLVVNAAHLMAKFASRINNFDSYHFIEGNHDRATEKPDRISNELAYIIVELLRGLISKPVTFHGKAGVINEDNINYVFSHGDRGIDSKDVYRILNRAGVHNRDFSLVLKGHKHSRMHGGGGSRGSGSGDDNHDCRFMHVPSIFTQDSYTQDLGFHSLAGFLIIEKFSQNSYGMSLPLVHDYPVDVTSWN